MVKLRGFEDDEICSKIREEMVAGDRLTEPYQKRAYDKKQISLSLE